MKNIYLDKKSALALGLVCAMLFGCETAPKSEYKVIEPSKPSVSKPVAPVVTVAPPVAVPVISPDVQALKEGLALYSSGDFNGTIKKLSNAMEIWNGENKALQLDAIKHIAFSYCVTSKPLLCQQQFERALKLDPSFELAAGEIGHPLWGPVFLKAKNPKPIKPLKPFKKQKSGVESPSK